MEKAKRGGVRKIGRNKVKCTKYALKHRRERNKIRKLRKTLKKAHGGTMVAIKDKIKELEKIIIQ